MVKKNLTSVKIGNHTKSAVTQDATIEMEKRVLLIQRLQLCWDPELNREFSKVDIT